ncbi:hypothetical protein AAVH_12868 [Aphelenchoides avenae]|nr:hypothetical protein AAVH_12868 [Aphelenchus avenae]
MPNQDDEVVATAAKSSRGRDYEYTILKQFDTKAEYIAWWSAEKQNWTFHTRTQKKSEVAETWFCKFAGKYSARKGVNCKSRLRHFFPDGDNSPDAEKKRLIIRLKGTKNYILSSGASKFANGKELFAAYRRLFHDGPANWDEYARTRFSVYLVQLVNRFGEDYYTCTCWNGSKKQICKHAVMVACTMEKVQSYPADVTAQTMKPNRKRSHKKSAGRDPLAPTQNRFSAAD